MALTRHAAERCREQRDRDREAREEAAKPLPGGGAGAEGGGSLLCAWRCRAAWRPAAPAMRRWRSKIWSMPAMHPIWRWRSRASSARPAAAPRTLAGGIVFRSGRVPLPPQSVVVGPRSPGTGRRALCEAIAGSHSGSDDGDRRDQAGGGREASEASSVSQSVSESPGQS